LSIVPPNGLLLLALMNPLPDGYGRDA
jgi:hypothetical protein